MNPHNQPAVEVLIARCDCASQTRAMAWLGITKELAQLIFFIAGTTSAIGAWLTYRANSQLESARWTVRMYEKFYEQADLKRTREALDCEANDENVQSLVADQSSRLTDYLNFFELLAILHKSKQMSASSMEAMFGYYLDCMQKQPSLMSYIRNSAESGFEQLAAYMQGRSSGKLK